MFCFFLFDEFKFMNPSISRLEHDIVKAHPVVPGRPICGMRLPCGGCLRRAREGIEWPRAIGVSTAQGESRGRGTATGMRTSSSRHSKNCKPSPVSDFARHLYILMNLGQRYEPLSFGFLSVLIVYKFIFLLCRRLVLAPRVSLVVYELALVDEFLRMVVCAIVHLTVMTS